TWAQSGALLPHAMAAVEFVQQTDVTIAAVATLLNQVGQCLFKSARFEQARLAFDRALSVGYQIYGESNPRLSAIALNLGDVLLLQGSQAAARAQYNRALVVDEIAYGPNHPEVARDLAHLAGLLMDLEDYAAAEKHMRRALAIDQATFGSDHPNLILR